MPTSASRAQSLAQQLADAHVAYVIAELSGERLAGAVSRLADAWLSGVGQHQIDDLLDRQAITTVVVRTMRTVPASAAASGIVELATSIAYDGPAQPYPLGDQVHRERVEAGVDALLALNPVLGRALERLTEVPLVGVVAARFMGRIVAEVMATNQAVANRVPGLGSLVSFGTGAASKVMGAADRSFEALVGVGVGKGGAFAVGRLNRILMETLRDPTTREAILQVWDLMAREPVAGLSSLAQRDRVDGVVDAVHDLAISVLSGEHAERLAEVVVDGFFERFGGYTPTELLDELDLDRDDLLADLVRIAPRAVDALRESGDLERLVRAELEPFYRSPEVAAVLGSISSTPR